MRNMDKYPVERDENRMTRQAHRTSQNKQLKFERIKKDNSLFSQQGATQSCDQTTRKFIYDQQTMNEMIQVLKEQNNDLKAIVRVQQTQINYFQGQEKSLILGNPNLPKNQSKSHVKKIELQNFRLRKQNQALELQLTNLKKTLKCTNIKQLQTLNQVYQEQLKILTAKIAGHQRSTTNVKELNQIIEKEYHTSIKNKEMKMQLEQKEAQLEQSAKVIRKLKNIIAQKNSELEVLKQERQKVQSAFSKNKIMDEYVHKSQLMTKKKQLLLTTETIQKLETKLLECEAKAQALQQENIDNMNRETNKRKQILTEYQKLKKSHEALEEALALSLKKNNESATRLDKVLPYDSEIKKPKVPIVVKIDHIKDAIDTIVYNLQQNDIRHADAALFIRSSQEKEKLRISNSQVHCSEAEDVRKSTDQIKISIREVISCLEEPPIGLESYEQKQLVARYLVETQSDSSEYISFDFLTNISCVRSIFKRMLHDYLLFSAEEARQNCIVISNFLKRNEYALKASLSKISSDDLCSKNHLQASYGSERKKGSFKCSEYVEAIVKQNELSEQNYQFIKFRTFKLKDSWFSFGEFEEIFKVEDTFLFITEEPVEDNQ